MAEEIRRPSAEPLPNEGPAGSSGRIGDEHLGDPLQPVEPRHPAPTSSPADKWRLIVRAETLCTLDKTDEAFDILRANPQLVPRLREIGERLLRSGDLDNGLKAF